MMHVYVRKIVEYYKTCSKVYGGEEGEIESGSMDISYFTTQFIRLFYPSWHVRYTQSQRSPLTEKEITNQSKREEMDTIG